MRVLLINALAATLIGCTDADGNADTVGALIDFKYVTALAPIITGQPASQTVNVGGGATFTVTAMGIPAPSYQWRKDGASISGATEASFSKANVQAADAGSYTVVVANAAGSVTSDPATLTIANGRTPTLTIIGGNNQSAVAGQFNAQPFDVALWQGMNPLENR